MKRLSMFSLVAFAVFIPITAYAQVTYIVYAVGENNTILELVSGQWWPADAGDMTGCGTLLDIWGSSAEDVYITGCGNDVLHYNGIGWERIEFIDPVTYMPPYLYSVDGTGPNDVYVGGDEFPTSGFRDCTAYHFDGSGWNYLGGCSTGIDKLWADPGGGLYAIGTYYDYLDRQYYGNVISYKSGTWSTEPVPQGDTDNDDHHGIDGAAPDYLFVTGQWYVPFAGWGGSIFKKQNSSWGWIPTDTECSIYMKCPVWPIYWHGVWCESESSVWFAGNGGKVMHWTPTGYVQYDTGVTQTLRAIWGSSNADIYAAGDYGKIVRFNGSTWTVMPTPTTENLKDVWGLFELPVATLLQSFSTDAEASRITIRWTLSEMDESAVFRVSRGSNASALSLIDLDPDIERNGLSFTFVDDDVQAGSGYSYLVEYSCAEGWLALFETGRIAVPTASLSLMPNYPNPFNPSTRITYSVPEQGHVSLVIYDVSGSLVRVIVDEIQEPGTYSVHWDGVNDQGRRAASGTYFCRYVTAKRAVTQKMLLTR
jgi:hypothetical protein